VPCSTLFKKGQAYKQKPFNLQDNIMEICKIGNATLIHGDCFEALPKIEGADSLVTDPPYGLGMAGKKAANKKWRKEYTLKDWDNSAPDIKPFLDLNLPTIIFGGNYFEVPPSSCWLVWDKMNLDNNYADCELAWTNLKKAVRLKSYLWGGYRKQKPEERFHPTQKPVDVMKWCISHLPQNCQTIFDPFMGSGTTGVAALEMQKSFIGVEKDAEYFEIACKRIDQAQKQLFLL
jgi:site-specific DNA-methyltransferase (adenine-specific)/modification methylase